ncbi:unnamed protein product (macronuclear) [Paramecium tetraurelia]|uniref:Large ribosomal subunit protein eL24-related N-terminal domain-containing protein n=1 Tax=Paramecium tetraurelia TaxID=5888 RepID=A0DAF5_PARTE|nr:uncharacterized protein GSPATT00014929001 [Paramecium tetraurelia]CAK80022.1 unnamed protein product [Paramecium tetraurelia]|eukprot:XP_001447419.1 hypothetical protein (macronuclear) [Paramecium tetraurelia strain d4-2]
MVIKTDLCSFSEWRIYPGHGRRFVAKDGRLFYYLNQKSRAFSARKIKSQEIQWTVAWRRLNKKIKTDEGAKKRRIRNLKVQRAIVGISLEEIRRRRKEDDKTRKAQAEQAAREIKDRKQKQIDAQKSQRKGVTSTQKVAQKAETKAAQKAAAKTAGKQKGKK